ncbi:DUF192 domain-containing protein [Adlercreutzia sp. R21]|uniref:DUF192 domain-containing protein n=1 Tax=Adlercreutzia wanghongyangiae TaxID=3111451 RepID=UPI002DB8FD8C|nr:DUF192 domain-containing protein [Adlercreutzia sp. R21]MEC4184663.1 DUF192 domain-containing protein [Adlercreutzia sp. R21]
MIDGGGAPFGGTWLVAASALMRLRGLAQRAPDRTVMVFPHCRDVHTLTMRHPLDIAFVSEEGRVVAVYRLVLPGVRLRHRRAAAVIERFAQPGAWFEKGDSIELPSRRGGKRGTWERGPRRGKRRIPWS